MVSAQGLATTWTGSDKQRILVKLGLQDHAFVCSMASSFQLGLAREDAALMAEFRGPSGYAGAFIGSDYSPPLAAVTRSAAAALAKTKGKVGVSKPAHAGKGKNKAAS